VTFYEFMKFHTTFLTTEQISRQFAPSFTRQIAGSKAVSHEL